MRNKVLIGMIALIAAFMFAACVSDTPTVKQYSVSVEKQVGGAVECSMQGKVDEGSAITFTIAPDKGYKTAQFTINGNTVMPDENGRYTIGSLECDVVASATFEKIEYMRQVLIKGAGDAQFSDSQGDTVQYKIKADNHYYIVKALLGGSLLPIEEGATEYVGEADAYAHYILEAEFAPVLYKVQIDSKSEGIVFVDKKTLAYGEYAEIRVEMPSSSKLIALLVNGEDLTDELSNGALKVLVEGDLIVEAKIESAEYTAVAECDDGVDTCDISATTVYAGGTVSLSVTPKKGYRIMSLAVNGKLSVFDGRSFTLKNVSEDVVFTIKSEKISYSATTKGSEGGSVAISKDKYFYGEELVVSVLPDKGYYVKEFKINGESVEAQDGKYTFNAPDKNVAVSVVFEKTVLSLTVKTGEGGSAAANCQTFVYGDKPTVTVSPNSGYMVSEVKINGEVVKNDGLTIVVPERFLLADVMVEIKFEREYFAVTLSVDGYGEASADKSKCAAGDSLTLTLSPNVGASAVITVNGAVTRTDEGTFVIENVTSNLTISVNFVRREYSVVINASEGGSVVAVPSGKIKHGDKLTVLLTANGGYKTESVVVNGKEVETDGEKVVVSRVEQNLVIEVTFAKIKYKAIIQPTQNGVIECEKTEFEEGEKATFRIVPDKGYRINDVMVGGKTALHLVSDGVLVITVSGGDVTVAATFISESASQYTCTSTLEAKRGQVIFAQESVSEGGTVVFSVKLNTGYALGAVKVDGKTLTPSNGVYTVRSVSADLVVSVETTTIKYAITTVSDEKAEITAPKYYTVEDKVSISVVAKDGYRAESVTVGERTLTLVDGKAEYSGSGDITISANCIYETYLVTALSSDKYTITLDKTTGGIDTPVTVTVTVVSGYRVTAITINGKERAFTGGKYVIEGITENVEVGAVVAATNYKITIVNYCGGSQTVQCGEVRADKSTYTVEDVVRFTVVQKQGYYLRSVTVDGVNYTDRIKNGQFTYSGKNDLIVVANFAADGMVLSGEVRDERSGAVVEGATVTATGKSTYTAKTNSSGRYSFELPNGTYNVSCSAEGYDYGESKSVTAANETRTLSLGVAQTVFSTVTDKVQKSYAFGFGENFTITGDTPSMEFNKLSGASFGITFTAENKNDASTTYEAEPGIGIVIKSGNNTFVCQFVARRTRIIINGDWSKVIDSPNTSLYDFNKIGEKHALAFVKDGDTLCFYAMNGDNAYTLLFAYSDERLEGASEYSFHVTRLNSSKTLKMTFENVVATGKVKDMPDAIKQNVNVLPTEGGTLVVENYDGGMLTGKKYRVYASPDYGNRVLSITVNNVEEEFEGDGIGGGYVEVEAKAGLTIGARFGSYSQSISMSNGLGSSIHEYDKTLFYRNDLITEGADPGVMYVSKEEDPVHGGWFYMTVTSMKWDVRVYDGETFNREAFLCYRSKDLATWETVGAYDGYALATTESEWPHDCFWAPEMMRDAQTGKYFLYFSARSKVGNGTNYSSSDAVSINRDDRWDRLYLGIAMADAPMGPYRLVDAQKYNAARGITGKATNANGETINGSVVPINFARNVAAVRNKGYDFWPAIDVSPFKDDNGEMYLYFSQHISSVSRGNIIWVMKMKDLITPDYSTMRMVSIPGYTEVTSEGKGDDIYFNNNVNYAVKYGFKRYAYDGNTYGNGINEGVNVIKDPDSGKYFLTYSPFGYGDRRYSIMQAVSDNPMGPFSKLPAGEANPVLGIYNNNGSIDYAMKTDYSASIDYIAGTGHHCFVWAGDELFTLYHAFYNPIANSNAKGAFLGRRIAADRVFFTYNEKVGHNVLYGNGPTDTLQALPAVSGGYANISDKAQISATNAKAETIKYLNDKLFVMHKSYAAREFEADNSTRIEMSLPSPQTVRAVMLYSAAEYKYAMKKAREIKLITPNGKEIVFNDVTLSPEYYNADKKTMHYGGAIIADFDAVTVSKIIITLDKSDKLDTSVSTIKVSDIVVLGKTSDLGRDKAAFGTSGSDAIDGTVRLDGKPFDAVWKTAEKQRMVASGINFEVMAAKGNGGVYYFITAYVDNVFHASNSGNTYKYEGLRRFYKNTGWRLELSPTAVFDQSKAVKITADAYNFVIDNGKKAAVATYVKGAVNGDTESFSVEAFVPCDNDVGTNVTAIIKYHKVESTTAKEGSLITLNPAGGGVVRMKV